MTSDPLAADPDLSAFTNFEKSGFLPLKDAGSRYQRFSRFIGSFARRCDKPTIIIAGTNGKGSTATYLCHLLIQGGYKTGCFLSPHIHTVRERITINNQLIPKSRFSAYQAVVLEAWGKSKFPITYFELLTAMAKAFFDDSGTDVDIFEAGLGGRFDAVNTMPGPRVSVLTSIGFDHTHVLGSTIEDIFYEKAMIRRPGPVLLGFQPYLSTRFLSVFLRKHRCHIFGTHYHMQRQGPHLRVFGGGQDQSITVPDMPLFQCYNLCLALRTAYALHGRAIHMRQPPQWTTCACRFEQVASPLHPKQTFLFDGAHNPDALAMLQQAVAQFQAERKIVIVFACMKDKDLPAMQAVLERFSAQVVIFTRMPEKRAYPFADATMSPPFAHRVAGSPAHAWSLLRCKEFAAGLVVVTGSFYLCGHMKRLLASV